MKNLKNMVVVATAVGILGVSGVAFAATTKTPAEITSGLTGKTVEELQQVRAEGKTYGTIAKDAGKLDEFKSQILDQKKTILDQRVTEGKLTQEKADEIYNTLKNNQVNCDGTGSDKIGQKNGVGFGQGAGKGQGQGRGNRQGNGQGQGQGNGQGMRNGSGV